MGSHQSTEQATSESTTNNHNTTESTSTDKGSQDYQRSCDVHEGSDGGSVSVGEDEAVISILQGSDFVWYPLWLPAQDRKGDVNVYLVNMMRKAKTHSARQYKFVTTPSAPSTEKMSAKKKKTLLGNYAKKWTAFHSRLIQLKANGDVVQFLELQGEIMGRIHRESKNASRTPLVIESCKKCLGDLLLELERVFEDKSCPHTGNDDLFARLGLQRAKRNVKTATNYDYYERQLTKISEMDRNLRRQPDPRCLGFEPTFLQRQIMDAVDKNKNIVVRSPASSGKTMLSLYLAHKMRDVGKMTLYIGPNKPVCNEFSLFVYNQDLKYAIGTEDFFNWEEMMEADVMICTPIVFMRMAFFPYDEVNLLERIGAVIFDEFPAALDSFAENLQLSLLIASVASWQTMIVSATLTDENIEMLRGVLDFEFLEPKDSIRPTDLAIHEFNGKKYAPIKTSSVYSDSLLTSGKPLSYAINLPITLDEFRETFKDLKNCTETETILNSLPKSRYVNGCDMTRLAVEAKKARSSSSSSTTDHSKSSDSDSSPKTKTPLSSEVFEILERLDSQDLLPALFFHPNGDVLNSYHREITELVQAKLKVKEKHLPKKLKNKNDELEDDEDVGYSGPVNTYGHLGDQHLAEIFKHKSDHSGAEGKEKIRLGYRGGSVKQSEFYPGLEIGLGIHHHAVPAPVRDAVESGLRLGFLRVVFCDNSMALGLNMPVKTVVFLADDGEEKIHSHQFIQASGRAGRWGRDKCGCIIFAGYTPEVIKTIWDPLEPTPQRFPLSLPLTLSLCAGSAHLRQALSLAFELNIPSWGWTSENAKRELAQRLRYLQLIGILDASLAPTMAGKVAITLADEGMTSILLGYALHKFRNELRASMKSPRDFLFVLSHFMTRWRANFTPEEDETRVRKNREPGPTLSNTFIGVSQDIRDVMAEILDDICSFAPSLNVPSEFIDLAEHINPTETTTALYVMYPNISEWKKFGWTHSELSSYTAHFCEKIKYFQKLACFPYGNEAIEYLRKALLN